MYTWGAAMLQPEPYEELRPMLESVHMPCTYSTGLFFTLGSGVEKTTASTETPRPEAKAQGPGRGFSPLTLPPEQEQNKQTLRRYWTLC